MKARLAKVAAWAVIATSAARSAMAAEDAGLLSPFASGPECRALALGGAFAAIADDAGALSWNPAGLAGLTRAGFQAAHSGQSGLGASDESVTLVAPSWHWGAAGLGLRHVGVRGIERRDDRNILLDGDITDSQTEFVLGYARSRGEAWRFGGALKLQHQSLAGFSDQAVGLDLGLQTSLAALPFAPSWLAGVSGGLAARNVLEPSLRLDQESVADPRLWRSGLGWRGVIAGGPELLVAFDLNHVRGMALRPHAGAEIRVHPLVAFRAGLDRGQTSAGVGLRWRDFDVDYAFQDVSVGPVHRVGIARSFGPTTAATREAAQRADDDALRARMEEEFEKRQTSQLELLLTQAQEAIERREFGRALELATTAATLDSTEMRARALEAAGHRGLAAALEQKGDHTGAALAFRQALAAAPGDSAALAGLKRGQEASERRAARDAGRRARFEKAIGAFASGELETARTELAALVASDPTDSEAAILLRRVTQALLSRPAPGTEVRDTPVAARPPAASPATPEQRREAETLYRRGVAALSAGRSDDALRFWELARSQDPEHLGARRYLDREYLVRGMEAFAAGRLQEAIRMWEAALRADSTNKRAAGFLTRARERMERQRAILGNDK